MRTRRAARPGCVTGASATIVADLPEGCWNRSLSSARQRHPQPNPTATGHRVSNSWGGDDPSALGGAVTGHICHVTGDNRTDLSCYLPKRVADGDRGVAGVRIGRTADPSGWRGQAPFTARPPGARPACVATVALSEGGSASPPTLHRHGIGDWGLDGRSRLDRRQRPRVRSGPPRDYPRRARRRPPQAFALGRFARRAGPAAAATARRR